MVGPLILTEHGENTEMNKFVAIYSGLLNYNMADYFGILVTFNQAELSRSPDGRPLRIYAEVASGRAAWLRITDTSHSSDYSTLCIAYPDMKNSDFYTYNYDQPLESLNSHIFKFFPADFLVFTHKVKLAISTFLTITQIFTVKFSFFTTFQYAIIFKRDPAIQRAHTAR